MSEYVFRYADGFGFEPTEQPTEHERMADLDHYGTVHEEIVRCRDCRAMRVKYRNVGIECWMNGEPFTVEPDGFCVWGEYREVGE